jgi:hypothetical protein
MLGGILVDPRDLSHASNNGSKPRPKIVTPVGVNSLIQQSISRVRLILELLVKRCVAQAYRLIIGDRHELSNGHLRASLDPEILPIMWICRLEFVADFI